VVYGLPWAWEELTALTYGRRRGEVYALGAGTGVGKTDFLTQQIAFDIENLGVDVACFFLEQQPRETALRIAGKIGQRAFHVPDDSWSPGDLDVAWSRIEQAKGKLFLYDSFGNSDWDLIKEHIKYLAHAEGVQHFYIDHLTALAAWQDDERKALELIMSDIGGLVKELDIAVYLISHLATPEGKPHEEGGRVMIRHLKGSRAIGFWCHFIFALERNQQDEDALMRITTTFRCLKDRYTGRSTGATFYLRYNADTAQLYTVATSEVEQHDDAVTADVFTQEDDFKVALNSDF
jgi:twinkle protein